MASVHIGFSTNHQADHRQCIHFHHFASLSTENDMYIESPSFNCFGHDWKVTLYPGGVKSSSKGLVAVYLVHCSGPEISVEHSVAIRDANGKVGRVQDSSGQDTFGAQDNWGWKNFVNYATVVDPSSRILKNGTLTLEVAMKPDADHCCSNFKPKNDVAQDMLQSFMDEETCDVSFKVKEEVFHVHKLILQLRAKESTLTLLCETCDTTGPVAIDGIEPEVFQMVLYYLYGGSITTDEWKQYSKGIINAADWCGVKNLKIEAEAWYVNHHELTVQNVIDTLTYAEEKNCFLLQEAATKFLMKNKRQIITSNSYKDIPVSKSIMTEILCLAETSAQSNGKRDLADPTELSINELRAALQDLGRDLDGPRGTLISQLPAPKKMLDP